MLINDFFRRNIFKIFDGKNDTLNEFFFFKLNKLFVYFSFSIFSARVGLMHIGVFILLLLSGERNFGVRLNKPYTATVPMDIPVFTGVTTSQLYYVPRFKKKTF